jgi:capsular polysaccharide biosynthesis protein
VELRQYLSVLRGRIWLILCATLVAAGAGFAASSSTATYTSTTTLYLGSSSLSSAASAADLSTDRLAALDRVALTFSKMIDSTPIAERAVKQLGLDIDPKDVVDETDVTPEPATQLLYVAVTDTDPDRSQQLANALADSFVEAVQQFEPGQPSATEEGAAVPQLPAYVFERATVPTHADPTDQIRTMLLATLFGLVCGIGLTLLIDYFDVSLRSAADVEKRLELPVLGVIPALGGDAPFGGRPSARDREER